MGYLMTWRELWVMAVGFDPPVTHFSSVTSAILVYLLALLFCYVFYQLSRILLPRFLQEYVLDFFKTMAFCTYCFGHGVIRNAHGHLAYILCVVPLNTASVFIFNLGDGTPLMVWLKYLQKQIPAWKFLAKVTAQIMAGLCSWELGHLIFRLDFHPSFVEKVESQANCSTDLNVATVTGFVLETVAVTYDFWLDQQTLSRYMPLDLALKILNCAIIVCLGLHLTGMYLHPAMATGHTFGCGPTPILSHILVYWGGPFIGIYIGLKLGQMFHLPISTTTKSQQPIKTTQNGDHGDSIVKKTEQNGHHSGEVRNRSRKKKHY